MLFYGIIFFLLNNYYDDITSKAPYKKLYYFSYTFLEYLSFTSIIYLKIKSSFFKKLILLLSVIFVAFQVFYYLSYRVKLLDSIPIGVETILIFVYIIYYFNEKFKSTEVGFLYSDFIFWIVVGIMIYLGGSFFFYILGNHMSTQQILAYWSLSYLTDIVKNILFVIAMIVFIKNNKPEKKKKPQISNVDMLMS